MDQASRISVRALIATCVPSVWPVCEVFSSCTYIPYSLKRFFCDLTTLVEIQAGLKPVKHSEGAGEPVILPHFVAIVLVYKVRIAAHGTKKLIQQESLLAPEGPQIRPQHHGWHSYKRLRFSWLSSYFLLTISAN